MDESQRIELLPLHADPPPLRVDEGGAVRIGNSRISLDLVVEQYENGVTPEDMVRAYDTLVLADVYAVLAYYLRHREEVRAYLKRRQDEAEILRAKIEAERPRIARMNCWHAAGPERRPMLRLASDTASSSPTTGTQCLVSLTSGWRRENPCPALSPLPMSSPSARPSPTSCSSRNTCRKKKSGTRLSYSYPSRDEDPFGLVPSLLWPQADAATPRLDEPPPHGGRAVVSSAD